MRSADRVEDIGANLREVMEEAMHLDEVVHFIDEFEEIAGSRDTADRIYKSITNEFLKQIPLLKNQQNEILLICATNYIRLSMPRCCGREGLTASFRLADWIGKAGQQYLSIIFPISIPDKPIWIRCYNEIGFTLTDIQALFQQVAHFSFEQELASKEDFRVAAETFTHILPKVRPSLSDTVIAEFEKDSVSYSRV